MLSRISLRAVKDGKTCLAIAVRPSTTVAKQEEAKNEVGYHRPKLPTYPGKVRMGFIPEEWFQYFYPKTGVTGPYVFGASLLTYLYSKEIFVMEHEFFTGCSIAIMAIYGIKKFGPKVAEFSDKLVEEKENELINFQEGSQNILKDAIQGEKQCQEDAKGQSMLFEAKRENIGLQLEAAYRKRLVQIHSAVKKKLDYQLETTNVKTRLEQKHMVNWIISNVRKSITPTQEGAALKQCLSDLKALAAKA